MDKLESSISAITGWFTDNCMRLNGEKCLFLVFGDQNNDLTLKIEAIPVVESREQKLQGIAVDKNLTYKTHVEPLM